MRPRMLRYHFKHMLRLLALLALVPVSQADNVSEQRIRADLKYLASDDLGGRQTPSKGLDLAADYIAGQFKEAGLHTVGGSYFQLAPGHRLNRDGEPPIKNVVGLLPGNDPLLKDTYVLVTAHYDHIGSRQGEGDQIFNGANDNASGTSGVMEVARALKGAQPKRSIVFICFFGEERGLQGSNYYGDNPLFPLKRTVAMLNIEMIGRTKKHSADPSKQNAVEDWTGKLGVTGFDFSDMGARLVASGKKAGIEVVMDAAASGPFFMRSDNRALAARGIPAHTVSVGYTDPEYHRANDHADTLDYPNMTKVVRALVHATLDLANDPAAPKWSDVPAARAYKDAWTKLQGG